MLHCNMSRKAYVRTPPRVEIRMSKQLALASAFSVFALSALALFAPGSARVSGNGLDGRPASELAAPSFSIELPAFG